eukprot:jgi/Hompol1/3958/HPOL_006852-RA
MIPDYVFKAASNSSGMLDTIEPRYAVKAQSRPFDFKGVQKVPYFDILNTTSDQSTLDTYYVKAIQLSIQLLAAVNAFSLQGSPTDPQIVDLLTQLQNAISVVPYAGIRFDTIDHTNKKYQYTLQVGKDARLEKIPGFPLMGLRQMIHQSQLSNAILRFSAPALQNTVITQGIRNFPSLSSTTLDIPFGSIIGRILYPLGISFLLPMFTISLVRDKESRIVTMMRMNGLGHPFAYYAAEYATFFVNFAVSTLLFWGFGALTSLELFTRTSWSVLLVIFFLWGNVQVTLAMFFNALFRQSRIALSKATTSPVSMCMF